MAVDMTAPAGRRILFTASTWSHLANFHRPYLRALADRGYLVDGACGGAPAELSELARAIPLPLEKKMTSPKNLAAAAQLRRLLASGEYDLVSCHTALAAFFTRLAVEGLPTSRRPRVVCIAHGYLFDRNTSAAKTALLAGAEKFTAPVTDLVLTMNRWDFAYASTHRLGRRVANIPGMGVDFSSLDRADPRAGLALREELGFGPERFLLVYGAEFSRRKSQEVLLRALALLPQRAVLLLPGQGDLLPRCQALARELGVADRVVFPGHVNMAPWYAAANAVVPSSRSEGLPFNLMEAMHCGLPAVASDVKGHQDLICHGKSGLLYPYGDAAACARQIQTLMDDPLLAQGLGRAGRQAIEPFRLDTVLPQVMEEYDRLLDSVNTRSKHIRI